MHLQVALLFEAIKRIAPQGCEASRPKKMLSHRSKTPGKYGGVQVKL